MNFINRDEYSKAVANKKNNTCESTLQTLLCTVVNTTEGQIFSKHFWAKNEIRFKNVLHFSVQTEIRLFASNRGKMFRLGCLILTWCVWISTADRGHEEKISHYNGTDSEKGKYIGTPCYKIKLRTLWLKWQKCSCSSRFRHWYINCHEHHALQKFKSLKTYLRQRTYN